MSLSSYAGSWRYCWRWNTIGWRCKTYLKRCFEYFVFQGGCMEWSSWHSICNYLLVTKQNIASEVLCSSLYQRLCKESWTHTSNRELIQGIVKRSEVRNHTMKWIRLSLALNNEKFVYSSGIWTSIFESLDHGFTYLHCKKKTSEKFIVLRFDIAYFDIQSAAIVLSCQQRSLSIFC